MKKYRDKFKDKIDMYDGTAILTEELYREIQLEAYNEGRMDVLKEAATIAMNAPLIQDGDPMPLLPRIAKSILNIRKKDIL